MYAYASALLLTAAGGGPEHLRGPVVVPDGLCGDAYKLLRNFAYIDLNYFLQQHRCAGVYIESSHCVVQSKIS